MDVLAKGIPASFGTGAWDVPTWLVLPAVLILGVVYWQKTRR